MNLKEKRFHVFRTWNTLNKQFWKPVLLKSKNLHMLGCVCKDQAARIYKRFIEFIGLRVPKPEIAQIGRGQLQKQEVILFGVFTIFPSVLFIYWLFIK